MVKDVEGRVGWLGFDGYECALGTVNWNDKRETPHPDSWETSESFQELERSPKVLRSH